MHRDMGWGGDHSVVPASASCLGGTTPLGLLVISWHDTRQAWHLGTYATCPSSKQTPSPETAFLFFLLFSTQANNNNINKLICIKGLWAWHYFKGFIGFNLFNNPSNSQMGLLLFPFYRRRNKGHREVKVTQRTLDVDSVA